MRNKDDWDTSNPKEVNRKSRVCVTHRDLLGVRRSYSTWCLSGMSGRMASNRGRRFGSLMTSFRSPTSTGRSMDLGEQKEHILTLQSMMPFRRWHYCSFLNDHSIRISWVFVGFARQSSLYQISFSLSPSDADSYETMWLFNRRQ